MTLTVGGLFWGGGGAAGPPEPDPPQAPSSSARIGATVSAGIAALCTSRPEAEEQAARYSFDVAKRSSSASSSLWPLRFLATISPERASTRKFAGTPVTP